MSFNICDADSTESSRAFPEVFVCWRVYPTGIGHFVFSIVPKNHIGCRKYGDVARLLRFIMSRASFESSSKVSSRLHVDPV